MSAKRRIGARRALAGLLAVALAATAAGCGLGPGKRSGGGVDVTVTRSFGDHLLGHSAAASFPSSETVMRLLQRSFTVRTRYGGGFVESIDGIAGSGGPRPSDWFYYVNGIQASKGAAATTVHAGDRIWWDHHDWSATQDVPAVVGSFPEPFRSGSNGKFLPLRIDCANDAQAACSRVGATMSALGLAPGTAFLGAPAGQGVARILVGTLREVQVDAAGASIGRGPGQSGVYARFDVGGGSIRALDAGGRPVRTLGAGTGLIAATRFQQQEPTWVVTGTDLRGVAAAAAALNEGTLANRFAIALNGGRVVPLPVPAAP